MELSARRLTDIAAPGMAALAVSAVVAATPPALIAPSSSPQTVAIRLTANTVPPGGLITSFLRNQGVYCSIICPLLVQTGATALSTALSAPGTFLTALPSDGPVKALGVAAASVTGPTEEAALRAIEADAAIPAQRALNAFETAVIGLLDVIPAAENGPQGIVEALQKARQDTYDALNAPFVPNPEPTVKPRGVLQVAVVAAINVAAAVIFPAFNFVLAGVFQIPNAVAQELAASGDPVRALGAGIRTTAQVVISAGTVIADSVVTAVDDVRQAVSELPNPADDTVAQTHPTRAATEAADNPTTTSPDTAPTSHRPRTVTAPALTDDDAQARVPTRRTVAPQHEAASNLRHGVDNSVERTIKQHRETPARHDDRDSTAPQKGPRNGYRGDSADMRGGRPHRESVTDHDGAARH